MASLKFLLLITGSTLGAEICGQVLLVDKYFLIRFPKISETFRTFSINCGFSALKLKEFLSPKVMNCFDSYLSSPHRLDILGEGGVGESFLNDSRCYK